MNKDQIKIQYIQRIKSGKKKGQRFLYPKVYTFNLTAEMQVKFKDQLQVGMQGLVEVPKIKHKEIVEGKTVKVPFAIIDLGHFDNEPHKPLQIVTMFKREQKKSQQDQARPEHDSQCECE